jgi:hypothetical protein
MRERAAHTALGVAPCSSRDIVLTDRIGGESGWSANGTDDPFPSPATDPKSRGHFHLQSRLPPFLSGGLPQLHLSQQFEVVIEASFEKPSEM